MALNMMLWLFGFEPSAPVNRCLVLGVGVVACIVLALLLNRYIWAPERMRPAHPSNLSAALRERKRTDEIEMTQQTGRSVNVASVTGVTNVKSVPSIGLATGRTCSTCWAISFSS
jgi:hypothetical protein